MANWNVAFRFLKELHRRAGDRRHLECAPEDLVRWYQEAFPTETGCQDVRSRVRGLLDTLADACAISLPKGDTGWIPFPPPKLPTWVRFPSAPRQPTDERHKTYPWGPELAFLAALPSLPHLDTLIAINTWLRDRGRDTTLCVPLRERSIEITGHEKALDALVRCQAFQPEPGSGVTLGLLRAFLAPPPLAYDRGPIGTSGKPVLVLENAHTWHSFAAWNRRAGRYAAVIYGNGKAFTASVPHLRSVIEATEAAPDVRYFGDLDYAGLSIPIEAGEVAWQEALPAPSPEEWLYDELLKHGPRPGFVNGDHPDVPFSSLVMWLPERLRDRASDVLRQGHRIAQEHVGSVFLQSIQSGGREVINVAQ